MNSIKILVFDPGWWFSVVLVALLISVLASFIHSWIRSAWFKAMNKYADNIAKRKKKDSELIDKLKNDKQLFLVYILKSIFGFTSISLLFLLGIIVSIMGFSIIFLEANDEQSHEFVVLSENIQAPLIVIVLMLGILSLLGATQLLNSRASKIIYTVARYFMEESSKKN